MARYFDPYTNEVFSQPNGPGTPWADHNGLQVYGSGPKPNTSHTNDGPQGRQQQYPGQTQTIQELQHPPETYTGPPPPNLAAQAAVDPSYNEPFYQRLAGVRSNLMKSGIDSARAASASALGARGVSMNGAGAGTYVNDALNAVRGQVDQDARSDTRGMRFVSRERRIGEARGFQRQQSQEGMKRLLNNWLDNDQTNAERYKRVLGTIGQSLGDLYGGN